MSIWILFKWWWKEVPGWVFFKHVVCGPLATDQRKCHIMFKLLFLLCFLSLCFYCPYVSGYMHFKSWGAGIQCLFSASGNIVQAGKKRCVDAQQVTRFLWPQGTNLAIQDYWSKVCDFNSFGLSDRSGSTLRSLRTTT